MVQDGILAVTDYAGIGALIGVVVSLVLGIFTYIRGKKADDALNMSTVTKTNLETQQHIIDQLQEDVQINRTMRREVEEELMKLRAELRDMRHENANLRLDVRASRQIIAKHEQTIAELEAKLEALGA